VDAESTESVVLMPSKLSMKWGNGGLPSPCCRRAAVDNVICVPSLLQQQYMLFTLQTVTACARRPSLHSTHDVHMTKALVTGLHVHRPQKHKMQLHLSKYSLASAESQNEVRIAHIAALQRP